MFPAKLPVTGRGFRRARRFPGCPSEEMKYMEYTHRIEAERLSAIVAIQQELAAAEPDLEGILALIARQARTLTAAGGAAIELSEKGELAHRAGSGTIDPHLDVRLKTGSSLSGECFSSGGILRSDDTETDARLDRESARHAGVRSMIVAPLRRGPEVLGILKAFSTRPRAFGEGDVQTLQVMAGMASIAVTRAMEFEARRALVAEHTRALKGLQESEARFRALFEGAPIGIAIADPDGRIMVSNPALQEMVGYDEQQLLDTHFSERTHPEDADKDRTLYQELVTGKRESYELEKRYVRKDGQVVWGRLTRFLVQAPETGRRFAIGVVQDITDRIQAEEERERLLREVQAERQRLADVFNEAPSFMCVLRGPDHVFERVNDLYLKLIGHRKVVGKPVREALPEVEGQGFLELLDRVCQTGETYVGTNERVMLQRQPGQPLEERYVDFVYQPLRDQDGSITRIFVQGVDLTGRKRAEEALLEIREGERRRIARDLHDLVLQYLSGALQTIQAVQIEQQAAGSRENGLNEALKALRKAISGLRESIYDLRRDSGKPLVREVQSLVEYNRQLIPECELTLRVEEGFPQDVPEPVSRELLRIVQEALVNVRRHSGARHASVTLGGSGNELWVRVSDDGRGFDTSAAPEGTGRSGMRERALAIGGELEIRSEPDKGTSVAVRIPLA